MVYMASTFLILCYFLIFHTAQAEVNSNSSCPMEFKCGNLGALRFPFSSSSDPDDCGLCKFDCDTTPPKIVLGGHKYDALVKRGDFFLLSDPEFQKYIEERSCNTFHTNFSFPQSPLISFQIVNLTLYRCNHSQGINQEKTDSLFHGYRTYKCDDFDVYYNHSSKTLGNSSAKISGKIPDHCSFQQLPISLPSSSKPIASELFELLTSSIFLEWELSTDCFDCNRQGGKCLVEGEHKFRCSKAAGQSMLKMILAAVFGGVGLILVTSIITLSVRRCKREKNGPTQFRLNLIAMESRYFWFQVPVFSYAELQEATNDFDPSNELGDGGFGTVY